MLLKLLSAALLVAVFVIAFVYDDIATRLPQGDVVTVLEMDGTKGIDSEKSTAFSLMNTPAPPIVGKTVADVPFNLDALDADVVLVNFWASWCAPCLEEFPSMLARVHKEQGRVAVVAISTDRNFDNIAPFFKKLKRYTTYDVHSKNMYWLWDEKQVWSLKVFNTLRVPETFILKRTPDGYVMTGKVVGIADWEDFDL